MLTGKVKLQIFAPTIHDPLTRPVTATISDQHVEFNDVSFTDIQGDPFTVEPTRIDIKGDHVFYKIIGTEPGQFADVDDNTGFNGSVLTFASLGGGKTLHAAHIVWNNTTLDILPSDVFWTKKALYINVDDIAFQPNDMLDIKLGYQMHGKAHHDALSGDSGDDLIIGGRGADTLTGRGGADTFQFTAQASSGAVNDFNAAQGDRIDFSRLDAGRGRADSGHFDFIGDSAFSGTGAAEIRVQHTSGDLYVVTADRDGDGQGDIVVNVHSAGGVHAGDFVF